VAGAKARLREAQFQGAESPLLPPLRRNVECALNAWFRRLRCSELVTHPASSKSNRRSFDSRRFALVAQDDSSFFIWAFLYGLFVWLGSPP
jgi:hypothetical protein